MSLDFERLYRAYYMQVYSYVMTIVKDAAQAEEVTQDTFVRAMQSRSAYRGEASEITWLCAIAKNAAFSILKRASRTEELKDVPYENQFEDRLADEESTLMIHMILHDMPEPYKEVFQLRVFGELSFAKIGRIFEKTESWARVTYHRARLKIQERMEDYEK